MNNNEFNVNANSRNVQQYVVSDGISVNLANNTNTYIRICAGGVCRSGLAGPLPRS